jgi:Undecaprenyl-phosphate glucose phosphotransferase
MLANIIGTLQRTPSPNRTFCRALNQALSRTPVWTFVLACEVADFLVVQLAAFIAHLVLSENISTALTNILIANAIGFACFFNFNHGGLYEPNSIQKPYYVIFPIFIRWSVFWLFVGVSLLFFNNPQYNIKLWILTFYCVGFIGFVVERYIIAWFMSISISQHNYISMAAVVGNNQRAESLSEILTNNNFGVNFCGLYKDCYITNDTVSSNLAILSEFIKRDFVDTVFIVSDTNMAESVVNSLIQHLRQQPLSIYLLPVTTPLESIKQSWEKGGTFPGFGFFQIAKRPINEISLFLKCSMDIFFGIILLICFSPIMAACAIGIRICNPGPILFRQKRIGYKGREFMIFKFRTMHVSKVPNLNLTTKNDSRVFSFGRFLRKTSLDELPQIFNVLRGEMSLVGPRPHMPEAVAAGCRYYDAVNNYAARHRVKPGITGWAQINGWRGPTETIDQIKARVSCDLFYIDNWSMMLDFVILFKTFFVFFGKNVY